MQRFSQLYLELDRSNRTSDKLEALRNYFHEAAPEDAIWAVYIITGHKIGRTVTTRQLRTWTAEVSGHPPWLIDECYNVVGDLSETLSLLIPFEDPPTPAPPLHVLIQERLQPPAKPPP